MLTIDGDPVCGGYGTFGKGIYLYIFYCLHIYFKDTSVHIVEEQVIEERDPDPEWEEDFRIYTDRDQHWREF